MEFDCYKYSIATCYLPAIFNANYSILEDKDKELLNNFLNNLPSKDGHFSVPDEDSPSFQKDEVSGLHADCFNLTYYVPKKNKEEVTDGH